MQHIPKDVVQNKSYSLGELRGRESPFDTGLLGNIGGKVRFEPALQNTNYLVL